MTVQSEWRFSDDRGRLSTAARRPSRVLAYVQAGATLWDYGIRPRGIFGSDHDGSDPDRAKTGTLPLDEVDYLGAGDALDVETLLRDEPDLVVAVSYGGGHVYGLAQDTAKHLEERVPVVVLDVGTARTFTEIGDRFAELAHSLGAEVRPAATGDQEAARERLRAAVGEGSGDVVRVAALSPAGVAQAHVARPRMWPELRVLAELGVHLVEPAEGPGANWSTVGWDAVASLRPQVVLTDIRSNATPLDELRENADWTALRRGARIVPWNPEPLYGPPAHARFLGLVTDAVRAARGE
ncbi:ABC transporter substrate-binding protein [Streptomyces sp. NBC_01237]|uniref:ABC transporter substrate-binding protein n=1 Tax=Streptomyces sp. NBC_01237 TaxID=2903790 RepID=UPI002DDBA059|nr:ABC transporter substrate-binding protein [Streptomyces sp. NBC_01237]WRZ70811.1 ABC transporter substrate-binding protein [Streptomyces sp. NBC_01237]